MGIHAWLVASAARGAVSDALEIQFVYEACANHVAHRSVGILSDIHIISAGLLVLLLQSTNVLLLSFYIHLQAIHFLLELINCVLHIRGALIPLSLLTLVLQDKRGLL